MYFRVHVRPTQNPDPGRVFFGLVIGSWLLLEQAELTGGPGSPGLPEGPSFPCHTKHKAEELNMAVEMQIFTQSHANVIQR